MRARYVFTVKGNVIRKKGRTKKDDDDDQDEEARGAGLSQPESPANFSGPPRKQEKQVSVTGKQTKQSSD